MKEQFIRNAQTQFLRETVEFYNSRNRAVKIGDCVCVYEPTPNSPGCAIGRHMPNKELCAKLQGSVSALAGSGKGYAFGPLLVLGVYFLVRVQEIHDNPIYWCEQGLSARGVRCVEDSCAIFGLDRTQVLACLPNLPAE